MRTGERRARGFAYVLLLVAIAVIGLAAAAALATGATLARRGAEQQLLAIGREFQDALQSYRRASPAGASAGPRTLEDLLKDPRVPGTRRHLRRIYDDPLTGQANWGLVTDGQGAIIAVYSLAPGRPIRQSGFEPDRAHFENAQSYQDWTFGISAPLRARP